MSCVAELNASSQKNAIVHLEKMRRGNRQRHAGQPRAEEQLHRPNPQPPGFEQIHHRTPQRLDDPRQIKQLV